VTTAGRREATLAAVGAIRLAQAQLHDGVLAAAAGAVVATGVLPGKLNALIRPLMSTLQRNPSAMLQSTAAASLARLLHLCTRCVRASRPTQQQRASPDERLAHAIVLSTQRAWVCAACVLGRGRSAPALTRTSTLAQPLLMRRRGGVWVCVCVCVLQ